MKRYLLTYDAGPEARLLPGITKRLRATSPALGNHDIRLSSEYVPDKRGSLTHRWLKVETEVEAADAEDAARRALPVSEFCALAVGAMNSVAVRPLRLRSVLELRDDREPSEFIAHFYDIWQDGATRVVPEESLTTVFRGWNSLKAKDDQTRVQLSLWWYNYALRVDELYGRFSALWFALESLEPLLRIALHAGSKKGPCKACGLGMTKKRSRRAVLFGIRHLLGDVADDPERVYGAGCAARDSLVHGLRPMLVVLHDIRACLVPMEKAVRSALHIVLGLTPDETASLHQHPIYGRSSPDVVLETRVRKTRRRADGGVVDTPTVDLRVTTLSSESHEGCYSAHFKLCARWRAGWKPVGPLAWTLVGRGMIVGVPQSDDHVVVQAPATAATGQRPDRF